MTPQLTEQYGQVLRVCVVREIFRAEDCACRGWRSKPRTEAPIAPAAPVVRKERREIPIRASRWESFRLNDGFETVLLTS